VSSTRRDVVILAYLDDIYMVGPAEALKQVLVDVKALLSEIGLIICDRKRELYYPFQTHIEFSVPVMSDGIIVLGTPIGKPEFVRSQCVDITKSGEQLCRQLTELK
jgi:hypothetical protein